MSTSINKIHVNNSTKISLSDRFTVIQSVAPVTAVQKQSQRKTENVTRGGAGRHKRSNSIGNNPKIQYRNGFAKGNGLPQPASFENRKFLEQLERKHKLQTALKLKRRSMKATTILPVQRGVPRQGQRLIRNRGTGGRNNRGSISNRLIRSNSLTNLATMRADLVSAGGRITRSNSILNLAARLGTGRRNLELQNQRLRNRRNSTGIAANTNNPRIGRGRSRSRQRNLSRSNSLTNLNRSNSRLNNRRSNSRNNLNVAGAVGGNISRQRRGRSRSRSRNRSAINEMTQFRGRGRGRERIRAISRSQTNVSNKRPVHSRLGVKRVPMNTINRRRLSQNTGGKTIAMGQRGGRRIAQGRIVKRKNSTGGMNTAKNNGMNSRQGRLSRTRGRGNARPQSRTRSQSRGRNRSVQGNISGGQRGSRMGRSRGRGGRGAGRGINRVSGQNKDLKREDLDKELDQYMSTTKNSSDIDM